MRTVVSVLVAAIVVAGCGGTPGPSASARPTAAATTPSSTGALNLPGQGTVAAGTYNLDRDLGITIDVAAGWTTCCGGILVKSDFAALLYDAFTEIVVYEDPCTWALASQSKPSGAAAIAAALSVQRDRSATSPRDVTIGGRPGVHVRVSVPADQAVSGGPDDYTFTGCDGGQFRSFTTGVDGTRYHQAPSQIDDFYFLDIGGRTVVFDMVSGPDIAASDKADLEAIIASVRIN